MIDFNEVYKQFKRKYYAYTTLPEEQKRRLASKFGKFYELEKDFVVKLNSL